MIRLKQKQTTVKNKLNQMQEFNQYNLFKRKNNYNEDDGDFGQLPEENMIVATWINDLGNNHKEYDDKIIFFNVRISYFELLF